MTEQEQKPKKTAILRTKLIGAVILFIVLLIIFRVFFMDGLIKSTIIKTGELIFGTRVEIGQLNLSLLKGELIVKNVKVGDKDAAYKNLMSVKQGTLKINTKALLWLNYHIEDMSLSGIEFGTPRKTSGWLPAPTAEEKKAADKEESAITKKIKAEATAEVKNTFSMDKIGDRMKLDDLTNLNDLKTMQKINDAGKMINDMPGKINAQLASHNFETKYNKIKTEFEALQKMSPKTPQDYIDYGKKADSLNKDIQALSKEMDTFNKETNASFALIDDTYKDIQKQSKEDMKIINDKLKFAGTEKNRLLQDTLGPKYYGYLGKMEKGVAVAKKLKTKKEADSKVSLTARLYNPGINIYFPNKQVMPKFLIKKTGLSGYWPNAADPENITITGQIKEIVSDQDIRNIPSTLLVEGEKKSAGRKLQLQGLLDLREDNAIVELSGYNQGISLAPKYWDEKTIPFTMNRGRGSLSGFLKSDNGKISSKIIMETTGTTFEKSKEYNDKNIMHQILLSALSANKVYNIILQYKDEAMSVDSNIDDILTRETQKYVQQQIDKVKAQITKEWDDKVNAQMKGLQKQGDEMKAGVEKQYKDKLAQYQKEIDAQKAELEKKKKAAEDKTKKQATSAVNKEVEKAKKNLLKGIKF